MKIITRFKTPFQLILIVLMTFIIGCGGQSGGDSSSNYYSEENGYEDGTYCA